MAETATPDSDLSTEEIANRELFKIHRFVRRLVWVQELGAAHREAETIANEGVREGNSDAPAVTERLAAIRRRVEQLRGKLWPVDGEDGS